MAIVTTIAMCVPVLGAIVAAAIVNTAIAWLLASTLSLAYLAGFVACAILGSVTRRQRK